MRRKIPVTLRGGEEILIVGVPDNPTDKGIQVVSKNRRKKNKRTIYLESLA
jgi:hypothetical protein